MRASRLVVASLFTVALAAAAATKVDAGVLITIDKSAQRMSVSVDGEPRWSWPVSTGRPGYATPGGSFTAFRMEADHYSKEWDDAPMPHSIFFTAKGHAIHGTLESRRLGAAVSHGCVRLAPDNAAKLFVLVKEEGLPNTKVVITGSETLIARRLPPPGAEPGAGYAEDAYGVGLTPGTMPSAYGAPAPLFPAYQQPAFQRPVYPRGGLFGFGW
jgi:hypothetical protein